eukprot:7389746-Prymnesium_polylepis.1
MEWSLPRVSFEGPAPRGRHSTVAVGTVLFIFGGGAQGDVYDDLWALDTDGEGLKALELDAAQRVGLEGKDGLDGGISLSFLVPQQLSSGKPKEEFPPELEYEDTEAREADSDEVRSWLQHLGLAEH